MCNIQHCFVVLVDQQFPSPGFHFLNGLVNVESINFNNGLILAIKQLDMPKVTFNNKSTAFFTALKAEVEQYFRQQKIKKTGNWKLYIKTGVLIPSAIGLYIFLLLFPMPGFISPCFVCHSWLCIGQYWF